MTQLTPTQGNPVPLSYSFKGFTIYRQPFSGEVLPGSDFTFHSSTCVILLHHSYMIQPRPQKAHSQGGRRAGGPHSALLPSKDAVKGCTLRPLLLLLGQARLWRAAPHAVCLFGEELIGIRACDKVKPVMTQGTGKTRHAH